MLAREVLRLRGTIYNRETPWDVMVDLYFCMSYSVECSLVPGIKLTFHRPRP